jgi:hypothetical protein
MPAEHLVRLLQITGAALGIPTAAAGTFAAYQSYFSTDKCHRLRNDIIGVMERNVPPETSAACSRRTSQNSTRFAGRPIPKRASFSVRR